MYHTFDTAITKRTRNNKLEILQRRTQRLIVHWMPIVTALYKNDSKQVSDSEHVSKKPGINCMNI